MADQSRLRRCSLFGAAVTLLSLLPPLLPLPLPVTLLGRLTSSLLVDERPQRGPRARAVRHVKHALPVVVDSLAMYAAWESERDASSWASRRLLPCRRALRLWLRLRSALCLHKLQRTSRSAPNWASSFSTATLPCAAA